MKVAFAQLNPLIGDLEGNAAKARRAIGDAVEGGADLVVFPELSIIGYPPRDLLLKIGFVDRAIAAVESLAAVCTNCTALIGTARPNEAERGRPFMNSVALCRNGRLEAYFDKSLLPTYDVFDESRYFEPAKSPGSFAMEAGGRTWRVGVTVCEDLLGDERALGRRLYDAAPMQTLMDAGCDLVVNLSASPFWQGKQRLRESIFSDACKMHRVPLVFVNQVGGNDELVFDGASSFFSAGGVQTARLPAFCEALHVVDLESPARDGVADYPDPVDSVLEALVLGTRDYVHKCGFSDVVLGLSGGIDSALTAAIAVEALGADRVHTVALPSRYSSEGSVRDARALADSLGLDMQAIAIESIHAAYEGALAPHFGDRPPNEAEENVQARIRGDVLMALSNKFGWLLLTTGNKSEIAVGYCTLYGDMCGGLAVISDVPKTLVYALARRVNARAGREVIPEATLTKPPSAELRPNQTDQDSLPPYEILDAILNAYVEEHYDADSVVERMKRNGADEADVRKVIRLIDRNEYKRRQAAPGIKVTGKAFGSGRRMPIAARFF